MSTTAAIFTIIASATAVGGTVAGLWKWAYSRGYRACDEQARRAADQAKFNELQQQLAETREQLAETRTQLASTRTRRRTP
jgi:hypothetical protein